MNSTSETGELDWGKLQASVISNLGVKIYEKTVKTRCCGEVSVPLTSSFVRARPADYQYSPNLVSLKRKLLNAFLFRLSQTEMFSRGDWLDIGGSRAYGNWLRVPPARYDIFNLPEVPDTTVSGDFNNAASIDYSKQYDGLISLNCLYMARKSEVAIANIMRLLKPRGLAVLDFTAHAYWYVSEDGDHWMTFNPLQVTHLVRPYMENFLIVPIGNLFEACADYYARRIRIQSAFMGQLVRAAGHVIGRMDRQPHTAMHYIVVGQKSEISRL